MGQKREADWYGKNDDNTVSCLLCPHQCVIRPGNTGICGVRSNVEGTLYADIYGRVSAIAMDPIEKKPLYHFYPSRDILSIGTIGCNLKCPYCQNWHISQDTSARTMHHEPEQVVTAADAKNSIGIAYTYSEPIVWYEYVKDVSLLAREKGFKNVMVTNGFINPEPLSKMLEFTDAMNIDLKSFRDETYRKIQKARLEPVKETIKEVYEKGVHLEVTTLVVTDINDDRDELLEIADFIAGISPDIPWHVSRYYPSYKYEAPATSVEFIAEVCAAASKKLNYVYSGNVPSDAGGSNTICPSCGSVVVDRVGYLTRIKNLEGGRCSRCGHDCNIRA